MQAHEIMTKDPVTCTPMTAIQHAALLMAEHDCGELPVVDGTDGGLLGVVTDRDITCRATALGKPPGGTLVQEVMSRPAISVRPETPVVECARLMAEKQIRRLPVVDDGGRCCGQLALADVSRKASGERATYVLKGVSEPFAAPSNVAPQARPEEEVAPRLPPGLGPY